MSHARTFLLPLALLISPLPAIAESTSFPRAGVTRLDISAEGAVNRAPDMAMIGAGVVTDAPTAAQAMAENARRMAAARSALKAAGIAERDIQTGALALNPIYRYAEGKAPVVTGYQAITMLNLRLREIGRAGAVIDALVARGINQIQGPSFGIDAPEPLLDAARVEAVKIARARVELYAHAAGLRVKRIVSISEGGGMYVPPPPPAPMMRATMSDKMAETSLSPGEQRLSVTLAVSFGSNRGI